MEVQQQRVPIGGNGVEIPSFLGQETLVLFRDSVARVVADVHVVGGATPLFDLLVGELHLGAQPLPAAGLFGSQPFHASHGIGQVPLGRRAGVGVVAYSSRVVVR